MVRMVMLVILMGLLGNFKCVGMELSAKVEKLNHDENSNLSLVPPELFHKVLDMSPLHKACYDGALPG